MPTQANMLGSIGAWTRNLRQATDCHAEASADSLKAMDAIDDAVAHMADGMSVHWKKQIRDRLWDFRQSFPADAPTDIRKGYEKLRNLTLDNTVERIGKGGKIPPNSFGTLPEAADIPNFQIIDEGYLRGGQPDQDGVDWLVSSGIKTVVDLRGDDRDNQWHPPVHMPIPTLEVDIPDFAAPTFEMVDKVVEFVDKKENQPVFIHCKAGIGRTGVITACRNIAHGMTADDALKLEGINSYHGTLAQEAFVRNYELYFKTRQAQKASAEPSLATAA